MLICQARPISLHWIMQCRTNHYTTDLQAPFKEYSHMSPNESSMGYFRDYSIDFFGDSDIAPLSSWVIPSRIHTEILLGVTPEMSVGFLYRASPTKKIQRVLKKRVLQQVSFNIFCNFVEDILSYSASLVTYVTYDPCCKNHYPATCSVNYYCHLPK